MTTQSLDLQTIIAVQEVLRKEMNAYVTSTEESFFDCRDKEIFSEAAKWQTAVWECGHMRHKILVALSALFDEAFTSAEIEPTKITTAPMLPQIEAKDKTVQMRRIK